MNLKTIQTDPAEFRRSLLIDADGQSIQFGETIDDRQGISRLQPQAVKREVGAALAPICPCEMTHIPDSHFFRNATTDVGELQPMASRSDACSGFPFTSLHSRNTLNPTHSLSCTPKNGNAK